MPKSLKENIDTRGQKEIKDQMEFLDIKNTV